MDSDTYELFAALNDRCDRQDAVIDHLANAIAELAGALEGDDAE